MTFPCYINTLPKPLQEASPKITKPSLPEGSVRAGAVISHFFNSRKLLSQSSSDLKVVFFRVNFVQEETILEKPLTNLL